MFICHLTDNEIWIRLHENNKMIDKTKGCIDRWSNLLYNCEKICHITYVTCNQIRIIIKKSKNCLVLAQQQQFYINTFHGSLQNPLGPQTLRSIFWHDLHSASFECKYSTMKVIRDTLVIERPNL